ncbi:MAG: hypothetical protein IKW01_02000 [Firmicutes bacterium]|nr:hypothetical protein [Bacillota bacterium]
MQKYINNNKAAFKEEVLKNNEKIKEFQVEKAEINKFLSLNEKDIQKNDPQAYMAAAQAEMKEPEMEEPEREM